MFGLRKQPAAVGLYGKHPSAPDFLRVNATGELLRGFDQWLSGALVAGERLSEPWSDEYDQAPSVGFLTHPHDAAKQSRCLLGAMAPSNDRSGRRFPLILFAEVERNALDAHFPAVAHHPFVARALTLLARRANLSHDDLLHEASQLVPPSPADLDAAQRQHDSYLDNTDGAAVFAGMFRQGTGAQQAGALAALEDVGRSLVCARPLPRFGVRFPLGSDNPTADAAFWLDMVKHLRGVPVIPHALWTDRALLAYFDHLAPKALAALWLPPFDDDSLCDLETSGPPADAEPRAPLPGQPLRAMLGRRV